MTTSLDISSKRGITRPFRLDDFVAGTGPLSGGAAELTFLDDPLVRFAGALDPVLIVIAFGRQQLCDLILAVAAATAERPGGVTHTLADLEFILTHGVLHRVERYRAPPSSGVERNALSDTWSIVPRNSFGG